MPVAKQLALTEEQVLLIGKALADPRRYEILKRLSDHERGMECSSVRDCFDISPATLSHHMKELEVAGLVQSVRKGKFVSYLVRREMLDAYLRRLQADLG
ncbi:ArsR family transcriptional regulator [Silvibacterium bohemicum]|uniref:ArsR family transcriptional regulator n=1 Tax=Silvibacterium bohemicum TaxID=1577686 RepID=A0A841K3S2_9BACT|nr:metalloregulator ArsR/SmtB family transcription factor [Silvibacterium bohemicum]MBB6145811.1 ArsR family transcriptional regulator [Silvibacterium bohemicum]